jgi:chemotaxis protein MotB
LDTNKRKQNLNEEPAGNLLQLMTVSLFIILLAFFILLNSVAVLDDHKIRTAIGSLIGSFGRLEGGYSVIEGRGNKPVLTKIFTEKGQIDFSDILMESANMDQDIHLVPAAKGTIIRFPETALFQEFEINIIPERYVLLDKICSALKKNNILLEISGHTDDVPADTNRSLSNRELASLQAMSVLTYCINQGKLSPNRITAFGWGRHRPAYSNKSRETRNMNRRVDILLKHNKAPGKPLGGYTFRDFFFTTFE